MSYKVRILYEDGSEKSFDGIEKDNVENIIEHHSKPINGKVKEVKVEVEDSNKEIDLDGYFAYMETLEND